MPIKRTPEFFKGARLKVGVIGCGYVGLPLGLRFAEAGHAVVGFDTDHARSKNSIAGKPTSGIFPARKSSNTSIPNISAATTISPDWERWTRC